MSLSITKLKKSIKSRTLVDEVSLQINQGEIVGLLGPNGAGKTTTFYMIAGLVRPDSGTVALHDMDISHYTSPQRARAGLSYLPQDKSIFRRLSVTDNIMAILELKQSLSKLQRNIRLESLLEQFKLQAIRNNRGDTLSGGECRRVEIARAIANNPHTILLDEPFAGVDPISISEIKQYIQHLSEQNIGVLITDHNVRDTLDICHRAYIIDQGGIIASGEPDTILANEHVRSVYLGDHFS